MGHAIADLSLTERTYERITEILDTIGGELAEALFGEMRSFFFLPDHKLLWSTIEKNVLSAEDIESCTQSYIRHLTEKHSGASLLIQHAHPFTVLHKIGMLGWIEASYLSGTRAVFLKVYPSECPVV